MKVMLPVVVAAMVFCTAEGLGNWRAYPAKSLPLTYEVEEIRDASSNCFCKSRCLVQPSCRAVSVTHLKNDDSINCLFSDIGMDEATLDSNDSSITYMKTDCEEPFALIENYGCLHIVDDRKSWKKAREDCRSLKSQLFVASSSKILENFANYLDAMKGFSYWVGVRNSSWSNGRPVEDSEWCCGDDNHNRACARMKRTAGLLLERTKCYQQYRYICQKL